MFISCLAEVKHIIIYTIVDTFKHQSVEIRI